MRIDKKKAMELLRISPATLGRRLTDEKFIRETGARKTRGKTNPVWTFDEERVRRYIEEIDRAEEAEYSEAESYSDAGSADQSLALEPSRGANLSTPAEFANIDWQKGFNPNTVDFVERIERALTLPHERALSMKEAVRESGIPQADLKEAILSGKLKARAKEMKKRLVTLKNGESREVVPVRYRISLVSLKRFVYEYLNE